MVVSFCPYRYRFDRCVSLRGGKGLGGVRRLEGGKKCG